MKIIIILLITAVLLVIDVKFRGAWTLIRWQTLRNYQNEINDLRYRLSLSGNDKYLTDAHTSRTEYFEVCRQKDRALAELNGAKHEIKVLEELIDRYLSGMSITSKENIYGLTSNHYDRDSQTGKFIPGNDEAESKQIRAYRMDLSGIEHEIIADRLEIKVSSVRKYISAGRQDLAAKPTVLYPYEDTYLSVPPDFIAENGDIYPPHWLSKYENSFDLEHRKVYRDLCREYGMENY